MWLNFAHSPNLKVDINDVVVIVEGRMTKEDTDENEEVWFS